MSTDRRERIARIIDPETFELIAHYNALPTKASDPEAETFRAYPSLKTQRDMAYAKADEILALVAEHRQEGK